MAPMGDTFKSIPWLDVLKHVYQMKIWQKMLIVGSLTSSGKSVMHIQDNDRKGKFLVKTTEWNGLIKIDN
jgi:hypothetical protein